MWLDHLSFLRRQSEVGMMIAAAGRSRSPSRAAITTRSHARAISAQVGVTPAQHAVVSSYVVLSPLHAEEASSRPPNVLTLSCAAGAHVPKPARRDGCHVRAAEPRRERMSGGVPPSQLCSTEALQRRTEAGPRQLQRGVRPRGAECRPRSV